MPALPSPLPSQRARARRATLALAALVGLVALAAPGLVAAADPDPAAVRSAEQPVVVWHGARDRRVVALTFDDGYAPSNGRRILAILAEEDVRATFFVNGVYLRRDPDLWRAIAAAGHAIGNHTYLHRDITRMSPERLAAEIVETRRETERVTGRPMAPIFRPPYGARDAVSDAVAAEAGFPTIVMWDVSAGDATRSPNPPASIRAATRGRNGSIVLLHVGPTLTPRILRQVIRSYRDRGFTFVTVPELLGLPAAVSVPLPPGGLGLLSPPCPVTRPRPECGEPEPAAPPGDDSGDVPADVPDAAPPAVAQVAIRTPVPAAPAARAATWARSPGAEIGVAGATVVLLLGLVGAGAALGRRGRRGGPAA